jgi:hypothetical protein
VITWNKPADITYGTALSGTQLNASTPVAGAFNYTPSGGTVLSAGNNQTLSVTFTPTDTSNYNNATKSVSINVLKATPVVTWNKPADITYGTALSGTQLNASTPVAGTFNYNPAGGTVLSAGSNQTLSVTFTPTDTANYNNSSKSVSINVLKATPVITWNNPADITYGTALSGTQLNASTPVAGTFNYTPSGGTVLSAGNNQTLSVTFTPTDTTNYNNSSKSVTINVNAPIPTPTPTPTPGLVGNVSTRLPVGTGDNVLIEGFIVQGPAGSTKKIIVRAIGPSLIPFGIADALADPTLEIHDASNATVATNDNWKTTQVGGLITSDQAPEIAASQLAPSNDLESAIIANLAPGSYTAIVRGLENTVGTGVVDAYDLSASSPARLANIATRGLIQPGNKLMIAGFIIQNGPVRAVVVAIGPSLIAFGITNALADTTLQLRDQNGAIVVENDNWKVRPDGSSQQAELEATGLQPTNDLEAAFVTNLPPGQYTAQVRGKPESTGIGVVQVYFLQ